jgi:N-acetyl sugar amidotransferase
MTIEYCTNCVLPSCKPVTAKEGNKTTASATSTINFQEGVCEACRWNVIKENSIDWKAREIELEKLLDRYRSSDGSYDVIVPASGGKDSVYVSHILKHKYGMTPLTVTWAPSLWTEQGRRNQENLVKSGFDNILISPNGEIHRLLTKLAFKKLGHPFQPFIFGQRSVGPKMALKHNVSLVFYGENVAEYGNPLEENYNPQMDVNLFTTYNTKDPKTILAGHTIDELDVNFKIKQKDLNAYNPPTQSELTQGNIEVHYMSYYRKWVPQENYYYSVKNTFFEPAPTRSKGSYSRYSGLDDKMEWLHYHLMHIKFYCGRAMHDAAQEVRTQKIDREEGVALVNKYDAELPEEFISDYLDYMDISEDAFLATLDSFREPSKWSSLNGSWVKTYPLT